MYTLKDPSVYEIVTEYIKTLLIERLNISNINYSIEYSILRCVYTEFIDYPRNPIFTAYIYNRVKNKLTAKNKRKQFYAILNKLAKHSLLELSKLGNWTTVGVPGDLQQLLFNLIHRVQNFKLFLNQF